MSKKDYSVADKQAAKSYKMDSWGEFIKVVLISGIFGAIGYAISSSNADMDTLAWTWGFAGFPWGYSVIAKIIDDWVELYAALASGTLWFIVFIIKIALSVMLGFILMPIKIIWSLYHLISAHSLDKEINGKKKEDKVIETETVEEVQQENNVQENDEVSSNNDDHVQKIKDLKDLLDQGVITQEEFDQKKSELLEKI